MKNLKLPTLLMGVLIALLVFLTIVEGIIIIGLNVQKEEKNINQSESESEEIKSPYESLYAFYLLDMNVNEKREYKINDDYTVAFEITDMSAIPIEETNTERLQISYNLYINNILLLNDTVFSAAETEIQFVLWNGYILYQNYGITDFRDGSTFIIDKEGKIIKEFRELDENDKGLIAEEIWRYSNCLIVTGSRIGRGYSVVSQGNPSDVITLNSLNTIPKDTAVIARYIYRLDDNGKLDLDNPEIIRLQTFSQYLKQERNNIISLLRADSNYVEGTLENFIKDN